MEYQFYLHFLVWFYWTNRVVSHFASIKISIRVNGHGFKCLSLSLLCLMTLYMLFTSVNITFRVPKMVMLIIPASKNCNDYSGLQSPRCIHSTCSTSVDFLVPSSSIPFTVLTLNLQRVFCTHTLSPDPSLHTPVTSPPSRILPFLVVPHYLEVPFSRFV